jgi:hypothetical protein
MHHTASLVSHIIIMICVASKFTVHKQQVYPGVSQDTTRPIQLLKASKAWAGYGRNTIQEQ